MSTPPVEESASEESEQESFLVAERVLPPSVVTAVVGEEGDVDFERLFEAAQIPTATVTAEKATQILESIPREVPFRVKCALVKTSLNLMSDLAQDGAVSEGILTDAAQKMRWIARLQEKLTADIQAKREKVGAEIARLEYEIAIRRAELEEAEAHATKALRACTQRTIKLHDVTLFFDDQNDTPESETQSDPVISQPDKDEDEPRELMEDESVLRLLGIPASLGSAEDDPERTIAISTSPRRYRNRKPKTTKLDQ